MEHTASPDADIAIVIDAVSELNRVPPSLNELTLGESQSGVVKYGFRRNGMTTVNLHISALPDIYTFHITAHIHITNRVTRVVLLNDCKVTLSRAADL